MREVGLIRKLDVLGVDMLLHGAIVARARSTFDVVDGSLYWDPNKTGGLGSLVGSPRLRIVITYVGDGEVANHLGWRRYVTFFLGLLDLPLQLLELLFA
jgi:hypothetical protein